MKTNIAAIEAARMARLEADRRALAKQIAALKTAQELALLRAAKTKFEYKQFKERLVK